MTHFETLLLNKKEYQVQVQVWHQFDDKELVGGVIFRQISDVWSEIGVTIDTLYDEICRDIVDNYTV